jgi:hypothetical protein
MTRPTTRPTPAAAAGSSAAWSQRKGPVPIGRESFRYSGKVQAIAGGIGVALAWHVLSHLRPFLLMESVSCR